MSRATQGAQLGRLLRRLVDEGLVNSTAVLDGRVVVCDMSRSNPVGLVEVDGRAAFVVKGGTISADGVNPIESEIAFYRWLGAQEATEGLAPRSILNLSHDAAMVTEPLVDAVSLHEALASRPLAHESLIGQLGRMLGTLHRARLGPRALSARRPWILDVPSGQEPIIAIGNAPATRMIGDILQCPPVIAAIAGLDRHGRPEHHPRDIKFDNVLVTSDRMFLVDWELAGVGEPVWDLAGVVDGLLLPSCLAGRGPPVSRALVSHLADPALTAHRAVAGLGFSPTLEELVIAVVARLAQRRRARRHEPRES